MRALTSFVRSSVVVAAALTAAQAAVAEEPKRAPELKAIRSLIGSWTGKGSLTTEGKTHVITANYDCVESAGAAGVRCKMVMRGIPGFTYQFDDLWGFSAQDGLTHWYTVTNAGEVHDHRGHFGMNGGQLEIQIPSEGKVFSEVIRFKRTGKSLALTWTVSHGDTLREKGDLTLSPKAK